MAPAVEAAVEAAVDAVVDVCGAGDSGTDAIDDDRCDGEDSVGFGDGFDDCVGDGLGDGTFDEGALDGGAPPVCAGVVGVTAWPGRVVAGEGAGDRISVGDGAPGSRDGDWDGDRERDRDGDSVGESAGDREVDSDGRLVDPSPAGPPPPAHADRRSSTRAHPTADRRTRLSIGPLPG